jgi:DNA polymerase-1
MGDSEKRLYLLDGMALVYRAHFSMMRNPRMTSRGMNTSTVFVMTNTLLDILNNAKPSHIAMVFDTPEPTHRHKMFVEYKAQREAMPEDLSMALPYVFRLCEAFNLPVLKKPGWEADDVIGTLARVAEGEGFMTYMVTPDKDYAQLVSEKSFVCKPGKTGDVEVQGVKEILEKWQIERVEQVIDILGLMGDTSDNVPGVPGVGEKTAQKLISQFGTIENLLENTDQLKGKQKERVEENREMALLSKELVTIDRDVPMDIELDSLVRKEWDEEKLKALFVELEFSTMGKRFFGEDFAAGPTVQTAEGDTVSADLKTIEDVEHDYRLADTIEKRTELIQELGKQKAFCFDIETTGLDARKCGILGLAFSYEPHTGFYVPFPAGDEGARAVLEEFRGLLEDPNIEKIGHNLKFDLGVLRWKDVFVRGKLFDTMLAAFLSVPDLRRTMDYLSEVLLGYSPVSITELIGEKGDDQLSLLDVDPAKVAEYASEDADITLQLKDVLEPKLVEMNQVRVFDEVECPLIPTLVEMEYEGVRCEVSVLKELSIALGGWIKETTQKVYDLAGEQFELNSSKQLGEILFDKLQLDPNAKRTAKTKQYQTTEQVLSRLAHRHEIVEKILFYRMCTKLKSTYVDQLPGSVVKETGRVHTHYEQAVAATGRLQSHAPNLQTIPIRTELGREIRKAFVARSEEFELLAADYSQIELRIAAELSGDEAMTEVFRTGGDIHTETAVKIYGEEADEERRRQAKTVNFGIIYGISPFGLAERLDISRSVASDLINQYFDQFPGVRRYMDDTIAFAQENGFVETITGRRRYLRDINSRNGTTRKGAERNAINSRIQGSAADMIKIAMSNIHREIQERGLKSRMLLQVHDELVFDMHKDEQDVLLPLVEEGMKNAIPLQVPIEVEMGRGNNWLEAH